MIGKPSISERQRKGFHEHYMGTISSKSDGELLYFWRELDEYFREKKGDGYILPELRATEKELKKRGLMDSSGNLNIATGKRVE